MADTYTRLPQTVTAVQWLGADEDQVRAVELFTQPSVVRYQPDGRLIVSRQEQTLILWPNDWCLHEAVSGEYWRLTDAQFAANYAPSAPG